MIDSLKAKVLKVLEDYPETRDSDQRLTLRIWCVFYPQRIVRKENEEPMIRLKDIMDLPREDNIKRLRAIIQNVENKFLPTTLAVAQQRRINEQVWRDYITANS